MPELKDITVTIRAIDKVSPVLRRLSWKLWWFRYGPVVVAGLLVLTFVLGCILAFVLGRVTA